MIIEKLTPFETALLRSIRRTVKYELETGTTGMSIANLKAVTPIPSYGLEGMPAGTNRQYYYNDMFVRLATQHVRKFLLP